MDRRTLRIVARLGVVGSAAGAVCLPSVGALGQTAGSDLSFTETGVLAGIDFVHAGPAAYTAVLEMSAGATAGDFNNDGWQDVFVLGTGTRRDALYINNGDGTFTDRAKQWNINDMHMGVGAAAADYDGDGDIDIFVTSHSANDSSTEAIGHHRLYRNNGDGSFTEVAAQAGVQTISTFSPDGWGASFGDYDLDGDLDLAVAGWFQFGDGNRLFANNGDGTFSDVTRDVGLDALLLDSPRGFSPRFMDMDGDRYPELIWTADFRSSMYFRNNADGTFSEATSAAGVNLESNGMGVTVADLNGDGLMDWYVTSIDWGYNFTPRVDGFGNMLYLNNGDHTYTEVSDAMGVSDGWWGWGTVAIDFDHDGDLDLAETNGWREREVWLDRHACLWLAEDGAPYSEVSESVGFGSTENGRGMLNFDMDNDGDQDVLILENNGVHALYRNDLQGDKTNWLRVFLDTTDSPTLAPHGIGARITATVAGEAQVREIQAGTNFISQSELSAHFGLSGAPVVDTLRVDWPDGTFVEMPNVAVNQIVSIEPCAADVNGDAAVTDSDFFAWVTAFTDDLPGCDQNSDRACDDSDFFAWVTAFTAGGC